jgi:hypothetical protein
MHPRRLTATDVSLGRLLIILGRSGAEPLKRGDFPHFDWVLFSWEMKSICLSKRSLLFNLRLQSHYTKAKIIREGYTVTLIDRIIA